MQSYARLGVGLRAAVVCITCLGLQAGCGTQIVMVRGGPTPGWVDRLPKRQGVLCAVGYSGPTFYQQDCVGNAATNARGHLSDTISATIRTVTLDISDGTRGSFSRDVFVEGSESISNTVLQGSEVEAQWMDMQGQRGATGGCYAMVCIDPSKPVQSFMDKIEDKLPPKTVEQVRQNAEAAFEDLEKEEARRAAPKAEKPAPKAEEPAPKAEEPAPKAEEPAPKAEEPAPAADDAPPPPADSSAQPG